MAQEIKKLPAMQETWVQSLGWEDTLEKGMAIHSSILAWEIPWTEEPGGLQSMGLQRVRHDWATHTLTKIKKKKSKGRNNIAKLNKYNCDNDAKRIPGSPKLRLLCIRGKEKGYPNCLRDLLMLRESSGKATTNTVKRQGKKDMHLVKRHASSLKFHCEQDQATKSRKITSPDSRKCWSLTCCW